MDFMWARDIGAAKTKQRMADPTRATASLDEAIRSARQERRTAELWKWLAGELQEVVNEYNRTAPSGSRIDRRPTGPRQVLFQMERCPENVLSVVLEGERITVSYQIVDPQRGASKYQLELDLENDAEVYIDDAEQPAETRTLAQPILENFLRLA